MTLKMLGHRMFMAGILVALIDICCGVTFVALMMTGLIPRGSPPLWFVFGIVVALWLIVIGGILVVWKKES